jgi:hypothetical protein
MPHTSKSSISKETYQLEDLCIKREQENKSELKEKWRTALIWSIPKETRRGVGEERDKMQWLVDLPRRLKIGIIDQRVGLCKLLAFQKLTAY